MHICHHLQSVALLDQAHLLLVSTLQNGRGRLALVARQDRLAGHRLARTLWQPRLLHRLLHVQDFQMLILHFLLEVLVACGRVLFAH